LPTIGKDSVPYPTDGAHGSRHDRAAWSTTVREVGGVLSSHEQRIWDDVQRFWAEETEEPPRALPSRTDGASSDRTDLPAAVVAGTWSTITLILLGAMVAGLTVGVVTALGWALWHHWPRLSGQGAPGIRKDETPRRPPDERWYVD
jgi:hypothetical protein